MGSLVLARNMIATHRAMCGEALGHVLFMLMAIRGNKLPPPQLILEAQLINACAHALLVKKDGMLALSFHISPATLHLFHRLTSPTPFLLSDLLPPFFTHRHGPSRQ